MKRDSRRKDVEEAAERKTGQHRDRGRSDVHIDLIGCRTENI
jgi:hypothetical protein